MKALVIGASGGIGAALARALRARGEEVTGLHRRSAPPIDLEDEASIAAAAAALAAAGPFDHLFVATGLLHAPGLAPEKSLRDFSAASLARYFAVNAIGPALVLRHFLPLVPRDRRAVVALLSARVGSISDNRLGGWVGYRASKAALNQVVRTVAVETARTHPQLCLVALHPGTVETALSAPFRRGLAPGQMRTAAAAADSLLAVIDSRQPSDSGRLFDWRGDEIAP